MRGKLEAMREHAFDCSHGGQQCPACARRGAELLDLIDVAERAAAVLAEPIGQDGVARNQLSVALRRLGAR